MYKNFSSLIQTYLFQYHLKKNSIEKDLFIDSRDFLYMIAGIRALSKGVKFSETEFKSKNVLIHSLIFQKWILNLKLLLPHEDEVLYNLKKFKKFLSEEVDDDQIHEVYFHIKEILGISLEEIYKEKPNKILKKLSSENNLVYKARYLLGIPGWKARLKYLVKEGIYNSDDEKYSFDKFSKTPLFNNLLHNGFSIERKEGEDSNIVDAFVLCI